MVLSVKTAQTLQYQRAIHPVSIRGKFCCKSSKALAATSKKRPRSYRPGTKWGWPGEAS